MPAGALSLSQAIENIDTLTSLESLFLGKNKITKLQNLDALSNLRVLSMQVLLQLCLPHPTSRAAGLPAGPDPILSCSFPHCTRDQHLSASDRALAFPCAPSDQHVILHGPPSFS